MKCPECKTRFEGEYCPSCGYQNEEYKNAQQALLQQEREHERLTSIHNESEAEQKERRQYEQLEQDDRKLAQRYNKTLPISPVKAAVFIAAIAVLLCLIIPAFQFVFGLTEPENGFFKPEIPEITEYSENPTSFIFGKYIVGKSIPEGEYKLDYAGGAGKVSFRPKETGKKATIIDSEEKPHKEVLLTLTQGDELFVDDTLVITVSFHE